jgi:hypothetical protein
MTFFAGQKLTAAALRAAIPQLQKVTVDQLINSTSQAAVLSFPVIPGTYVLSGRFTWVQGATQAVQALRLTGPTATLISVRLKETELAAGGESTFGNGLVTAYNTDLSGASGGQPATTTVAWDFDGIVVLSAAGTLGIAARCVTSGSDTFTIKAGSSAQLVQG